MFIDLVQVKFYWSINKYILSISLQSNLILKDNILNNNEIHDFFHRRN